MKMNMGTVDRVIRTLIAIVIGVLYFTGTISGVLAIILGVIAIVFLLTSLVGRCPGYSPLGLSTRKEPPGSTPA
jgi:K+-transporting ATPase A subunit